MLNLAPIGAKVPHAELWKLTDMHYQTFRVRGVPFFAKNQLVR